MNKTLIVNDDLSLYVRKIDLFIQQYLTSCWEWKKNSRFSLTKLQIADFIYNNQNHLEEGIRQEDIEHEFLLNQPVADELLKDMEKENLICFHGEGDRRNQKIEVTIDGIRFHVLWYSTRTLLEKKIKESLSPEELDQFKSLCIKIIQGINEQGI